MTVSAKDFSSSSSQDVDEGDGDAAGSSVSYERFVNLFNTALSSVTSTSGGGSAMMLDETDTDIIRQVALLYRVTKLAVNAVGRGTSAAASLLRASSRCYQEQFAARVADQDGLVGDLSLK